MIHSHTKLSCNTVSVFFPLQALFHTLLHGSQIKRTCDAMLAAPSRCQQLQNNNFPASLTARLTNRMLQAWHTFSVGCSSAYSVMAAALRTWSWESARRQSRATKTRSGIFCKHFFQLNAWSTMWPGQEAIMVSRVIFRAVQMQPA